MRRLLPFLIVLVLLPQAVRAQVLPPAYPDTVLTPGTVFLDATADDVCTPGYARSVRDVTRSERSAVFAAYGLADDSRLYEVDHFVPLELGGTNDLENLWPEPYDPFPGAYEKDAVENYLHDAVCAGQISLADAQDAIATDWYAIYQTIAAPVRSQPVSVAVAPSSAHTWYTSSVSNATTYYCDDDQEWQTLSPRNLTSFPSVAALLAVYPDRHLHQPCRDGATGP